MSQKVDKFVSILMNPVSLTTRTQINTYINDLFYKFVSLGKNNILSKAKKFNGTVSQTTKTLMLFD